MPEVLLLSRKTIGVDRVLLGGGAIFASPTGAVRCVEESEYLTAEDRAAIVDHNAPRMLRLPDGIGHPVGEE